MADQDDARISEIIELAWDDETSFDAIKEQTGLSENEVIGIMRRHMKPSSFRMWRKRVSGRASKHASRTSRKGDTH
ncbi:MAG: TIGR03643 family protein [Pseudomonadota bacterium]